MIILFIRRMAASFGKLQNHTLELQEGLNIIQAPNESGKSTWCAFLTSMLYGINSRERDKVDSIADKNRYMPWSGTPMAGRIDCLCGNDELTIMRATRRSSAPMGEFKAIYAGTGDSVPGLTGLNCGETLLGVSREVFERSAFIRQAGLTITPDAGLERRITALITSGEENASYSEATRLLKKQLNRRRHNKTGQLPQLDSQLEDARRRLAAIQDLEAQLAACTQEITTLQQQEAALTKELALHDQWTSHQKQQELADAEAAAAHSTQVRDSLRTELTAQQIPESETIARLRGAIVNLETVRKSVEKARSERDAAMKALLRAEAAVNESPFAGQTPERAHREAANPPQAKTSGIAPILAVYSAAATLVAAIYFKYPNLPDRPALLFIGLPLIVLSAILSTLLNRRARRKAQNAALIKRFRTADMTQIAALADTYSQLCASRDAAQSELEKRSTVADTLYSTLSSNEQGILLEVRRFAPTAYDIPTADALLRSCAQRRQELIRAEAACRENALHCDILRRQLSAAPHDPTPTARPTGDQNQLAQQAEQVRFTLAAARSKADQLTGRLHAMGDPAALDATISATEKERAKLEAEYNSIQLALETLDSANTALQNRFSPTLGRRTAEIFQQLTNGRYSSVVLDRSFHLSAEPTGDSVYQDAQYLSAGALDQLYLAVRLAICELVLGQGTPVPIILDDALTNFDDERCATALRWLKEESKHRQIILFTCHNREAEFFAGDSEVSVQRLTNSSQVI